MTALLKGTSKNWHMARNRRLWRTDKEQTLGAAPLRAVTGFVTRSESIRICFPAGCESFWLKEECSSVGVSLRYASVQKFFLSFQKSSATRHVRIFRGSLRYKNDRRQMTQARSQSCDMTSACAISKTSASALPAPWLLPRHPR